VKKSDVKWTALLPRNSVRNQQESLSDLRRKCCPELAGISVRFTQEPLSGLARNQCPDWSRICNWRWRSIVVCNVKLIIFIVYICNNHCLIEILWSTDRRLLPLLPPVYKPISQLPISILLCSWKVWRYLDLLPLEKVVFRFLGISSHFWRISLKRMRH